LADGRDDRPREDDPPPGAPRDVADLERLLAHPRVRKLLGEIAREEAGEEEEPPQTRWQRFSAFVAGASSALVVLLAFLIPSVEEQWDRWQSRRVVQQHATLARTFMSEGKYKLAEESFARAFELSENKRLDIDEERLEAKVQAVNADPDWGGENPEGLEESDFLYLLTLQAGPKRAAERAATLNCYGTFLASGKRWREAEQQLREAARLAPHDAAPLVSLGNLFRDRGRLADAEAAYRRALRLDAADGRIPYDLGLLLEEQGRAGEALAAFEKAVACDPRDAEFLRALAGGLERSGRSDEARKVLAKARALDAGDGDVAKPAAPPG
jgi:Tfp pilus assembly protein PilF